MINMVGGSTEMTAIEKLLLEADRLRTASHGVAEAMLPPRVKVRFWL